MRTYLSARDCRALLSLTNLIYTLPDRETVLEAVTGALERLVPYSSAVYLAMDSCGFRRKGHLLQGVGERELAAFTEHYAAIHPFTRSGWIHHANAAARLTDFVPAYRLPDTEYGRDFMAMGPFSWETGVILQAQGDMVGALCLHRRKPERDFTDREILVVNSLAPHLARVLNHFDLLDDIRNGRIASDAGILALGPEGEATLNPVAAKMLKEAPGLLSGGIPGGPSPVVLESAGVRYRLRSTLGGPGKGRILLFEPLPQSETVSQKMASWNLTDRQREILLHLMRGASNREIAETLALSEETVKDHLKAVYDKAGVKNRTTLMARIYSGKTD